MSSNDGDVPKLQFFQSNPVEAEVYMAVLCNYIKMYKCGIIDYAVHGLMLKYVILR